ncbi:hypothetical protein MLD38_007837 [Melastoma candidum]|uniref:Uncharacterized protein n=1 Tax=Melastoma candidum TaxID=119954 RepID=A0ACB9RWP3_9MYRT|nr:hypothetical protein MLD38_007837 [Melastoma candidum]
MTAPKLYTPEHVWLITLFRCNGMQARPCIDREEVEAILDASLLSEPCNMQVMLKVGQLALRCVEKSPKQRPTMTQVWQELEQVLQSDRATSTDDASQSFVSVNGVALRRFHVDADSLSFRSASLRCLDTTSIVIDTTEADPRGTLEMASEP